MTREPWRWTVGPVERAVRASVAAGLVLRTPGQNKPFTVDGVDGRGVVLLLGVGEWETRLPWEALEGVPAIFRGKGWMRTTGSFYPNPDTTTLDGHLKQYVSRETANWVAVLLERAGVLELDRSRPVKARLSPPFDAPA
jgi:hypothetical protein